MNGVRTLRLRNRLGLRLSINNRTRNRFKVSLNLRRVDRLVRLVNEGKKDGNDDDEGVNSRSNHFVVGSNRKRNGNSSVSVLIGTSRTVLYLRVSRRVRKPLYGNGLVTLTSGHMTGAVNNHSGSGATTRPRAQRRLFIGLIGRVGNDLRAVLKSHLIVTRRLPRHAFVVLRGMRQLFPASNGLLEPL